MRCYAVARLLWLASLPLGALAQDNGPTLDELIAEMQRPLPPLEEEPVAPTALPRVAIPAEPSFGWVSAGWLAVWSASLFLVGWRAGAGTASWIAVPATAGSARQAAPPEPPPEDPKTARDFPSWPALLKAARAGNPLAREVLDYSPGHPTVCFALTEDEFRRHIALARNLRFSPEWVRHILSLLEGGGGLTDLTVVSPLGEVQELPVAAPLVAVNRALGYETLPADVREQLEVRRWILWQTREDGAERPEVLNRLRRPVLTLPS